MNEADGSPKTSERVLVVDDDRDARVGLERSLRRLGYEVTTAEDGEEGLKLAVQLQPHVLLADIRMPKMDGHTLLRRVGSLGLDTAVIVISAHGDRRDVIDVLRNGAVDYLEKPYASSELVAAVTRAVEIHDQRERARLALGRTDPIAPSPAKPEAQALVAPKADPIFAAILDQLRRGEITLPPIPAVISELLTLLGRPDSDMAKIASVVERDPRLVAQLLRITNTVQYARGTRVNDLRTAVERIGLRQMESIVQTMLSHDYTPAKDPALRQLQTRIWRYSVARAVSMRGLAELAGGGLDPEVAYLSGLLADAGASFLLWVTSERIASGPQKPPSPEASLLGLQEQHEEVGSVLLAHWSLDPVVAKVAKTHHRAAPPAPHTAYWSLAVLATALADQLSGNDDPTRTTAPSPAFIDRVRGELRIGTTGIAKIEASVRREFEGVMDMLS